MIDLEFATAEDLRTRIVVVGVGGAGGNAVTSMMRSGVEGVDFIVANTDAQALNASLAPRRLQLGRSSTQGLGAGACAEVGKTAAEESMDDILSALDGAHMCFIAAGMGGGTGTGAAPVIAAAARARGILTVGVVTKPFAFEGRRRMEAAEQGIAALNEQVDTLIVIPNQNLFRVADPSTTFKQAFQMADEVLDQGVRSISDLMVMPGLINLDFADVRSIMSWMGKAMLGCGEASGDERAILAAEKAISNPLLDGAIDGAKGLIISISGGEDMRLMEVDEAANHIKALVDPDADIVWGSAFDPELTGKIRVSVVATGIDPRFARASTEALFATRLETQIAPARELADGPAPFILPVQPVAEQPLPSVERAEPEEASLDEVEPQLALTLLPAPESPPLPAPLPVLSKPIAIERIAVSDPRGPSLFGRIAALARGGDRSAPVVQTAESDPMIYRRRPIGGALHA